MLEACLSSSVPVVLEELSSVSVPLVILLCRELRLRKLKLETEVQARGYYGIESQTRERQLVRLVFRPFTL